MWNWPRVQLLAGSRYEHFVRLGMCNFEVLQSATIVFAGLLQIADRTGRIEAGFEADMILVPANPLADIAALQDVLMSQSTWMCESDQPRMIRRKNSS